MKTIMFFCGFYLPHLGGVERYTNNLVKELKNKYNIIIVTTNDNNYTSYEKKDGVKIYRLPTYSVLKNRFPILKKNKEYRKLIKEIKSEKVDYTFCNARYYGTTILGLKLGKKNNSKLLVLDHSSDHITLGNFIFDKLIAVYEHYITSKIKRYNPNFYGVSKRCNEWLKHFKINSSGVFYNSIDGLEFNKYYKELKNDKIMISYIGRLIQEKGVLNLLEAFKNLSKKYNNIELSIAGDGPLLDKIKKDYKAGNIHFLGKIDHENVMNLCVRTDIFVHPSMYPEGLPTSILEAGIMKTAIVATDRGGTKEVIKDDSVGIIVEENSQDLYDKLEYLILNPSELDKYKENIHKRIMNNFTWKQTAVTVDNELKKCNKYINYF